MRRRIPAGRIVAGVTAAACWLLLLFVSYWLAAFALLALVCYALYRLLPGGMNRAVVLFVCLILAAMGVGYVTGLLRPGKQIGSCTASLVNNTFRYVVGPASGQSERKPEGTSELQRLRERAFILCNRIERTLRTQDAVEESRRLLDNLTSQQQSEKANTLRSGLDAFNTFLRQENLLNRSALREKQRTLIDALRQATRETATDAETLRAKLERLEEQNALLFELYDKISSLQAQNTQLASAFVAAEKVVPEVSYDDHNVRLDERITLKSAAGAALNRVDIRPLQLEADRGGFTSQILVNDVPQDAADEIRAEGASFSFTSRRIAPIYTMREACHHALFTPIERLEPVWPAPLPIQLVVVSNHPQLGQISATVDLDRSQGIERIRLPLRSYLASGNEPQLTAEKGADVLKYAGGLSQLNLRGGDNGYWVELFAPNSLVRNYLVQNYRQYLVAEHAGMAVIVFAVGLLISRAVLKQ